jgi:glutaminyl-peptide cyclotransferase
LRSKTWKAGWIAIAGICSLLVAACGHGSSNAAAASNAGTNSTGAAGDETTASSKPVTVATVPPEDQAPPPSKTGGFDGQKAYDYTAKLVGFGPRPPASAAISEAQAYITGQLKSFGCDVDTDDFHAGTPIGDLAMKNIIAKIPGTGRGVILLLTHYDTLRLPGFVGADDGGSSTGLMLEMASVLCSNKMKPTNSVWIAFLDGEEAQLVQNGVAQWTDADSVFGSRELAARMDLSGDLKNVRALILADMVGQKDLQVPREEYSTKWLAALVWNTADRLGYRNVFVPNEVGGIEDDHGPFLKRGVPCVDIIELNGYPYWHTTQDTMDKLSPKSFAVVGYVILESVAELQRKFR